MDILNWLYLAKNKFVRTTLGSTKDLMIFGANVGFTKRGDKYQNYAMSVEDFTAAVVPTPTYKVYTALLTQSGGDAPDNIVSGNTVIGVTYQIDGSIPGDDFRNIGGPLITYMGEFQNYYFVATGTTPTVWTNGTSLNFNTGAPVVTVLENTIGSIFFTYNGVGLYVAHVPIVAEQKQVVFSPTYAFKTNFNENYIKTANNSIDGEIEIYATDGTSGIDGLIVDFPIEIRVYN